MSLRCNSLPVRVGTHTRCWGQTGHTHSALSSPMDVEPGEARVTWDSPVQFFFTVLGFCVGLGNIWRFPYLCQQNGGGQYILEG